MLEWTYRIGLGLIVVMGLMAFATTIRAPNGYGRYLGSKLEGTIAARPGWLIFEAPQWMAFALTFWLTARAEPPQMVSRDLRRLPARAKSADPVRALNVIPAKAGIHSRGGCGLIRKASQNGFPPSRE